MSALTGSIGFWLERCVRAVLRIRKLVIVVALAAAALGAHYASTRLGINTDTTNMIAGELPWRRHFNDFRQSFPARDRNIVVAVEAASAERADAFSEALVARLAERPDLFGSLFAGGAGEFFERNGLLYLSVDQLEALADRLAAAQPLIGLLKSRLDGAAVLDLVRRTVGGEDAVTGAEAAGELQSEVAASLAAAADGRHERVAWRRLVTGEAGASGADARRVIALRPELDFSRLQPAAPAIEALRGIAADLAAGEFADVTVGLTGTVVMEHEEMLSVRNGAGVAALASLLLVALVLYASLRSLKLIAIALVTLLVGLVGTGAFAAAAVGHLNLLSVAFAVLYVGLGVDFIIHMSLRLKELLAAGRHLDDAIAATARGVGASLVICAVTTAVAFYAFIPTQFEGVSELGLISGTGMLISLVVSFTLLPALLGQVLSARDGTTSRTWLGTRGLAPLAARPKRVLAGSAAIVAVTFALLPAVEFDSNPIHLRDPHSESVRVLQEMAAEGEAPIYNLVAVAPDHRTAAEWARALHSLPTVRAVTTVEDLVPAQQEEKLLILEDISLVMGPGFGKPIRSAPDAVRLERALRELEHALGAAAPADPPTAELGRALGVLLAALRGMPSAEKRLLLEALDADLAAGLPGELERLERGLAAQPFDRLSLPDALAERWIGSQGRELIEIAPRANVNDNEAARRFVAEVRSVVPNATGLPVVYHEASRVIVRSFQLALTYALVMVAILLLFFLSGLKDVVLVLVPIMLAAGVTAGMTVLIGIPLNFANVITLPLLVGVGVDNGIHMVHRMRSEPPPDGQPFGTSTSAAMLASGLTTVASFGNLGFSRHQGMASMGQLLTLGMLVTLAATLLLLPALLKLWSKR